MSDTNPTPPPLDWRALGEGPPIVLVHGALADRRLWDRHLPLLAQAGYRAIAVTLPHHGPLPLPPDPRPFGLRAHTDALADFIDANLDGPVHLVAWSYGAHAALTLAVERSALLRSVFVHEPGIPTYLESPQDLQAFAEDAQSLFAPVVSALEQGNPDSALAHLIDGSASCPGYFSTQHAQTRQIERENAHTLPQLLKQTPAPALNAAQLRAIGVPVCVAMGEHTRPAYGIVTRAAQSALPTHALTITKAGHMWPDEDPAAFCAAVLDFVITVPA
jgi:pimeloyl-ACP methyl ester carboxylesterase